MASESSSRVRQNFHVNAENGINKQINLELYASYVYLSMAAYFDRDDVAHKGFHDYFAKSSTEEREHAGKLIKYQNMRGGRVVFKEIPSPAKNDWGSPLEAMQEALKLEKSVNASLLDLHRIASEASDPQMCDFIETEFLLEQVKAIKEISDHITNLVRVGPGLGEYMYDRTTMVATD